MKKCFILLACLASLMNSSLRVYAVGPCTVCLSETEEGDPTCANGHSIHSECLKHQTQSFVPISQQNAQDTLDHGLACCTEKCEQRHPLRTLQERIDQDTFEQLMKRLQPRPPAVPRAAALSPKELRERAVYELRDQVRESFNRECPGCGGILSSIEGCNAAFCEKCDTRFCNLCLAEQTDGAVAHSHVREHSGDFWEGRDFHTGRVPEEGEDYEEYEVIQRKREGGIFRFLKGLPGQSVRGRPYTYTDRYHWLIARKKLQRIFRSVPDRIRDEALRELKPLLSQNKMWPVPAAYDTETWTQKVLQSTLDYRNKVALLQNEMIYLQNEFKQLFEQGLRALSHEKIRTPAYRVEIVRSAILNLKAPVLASLDIPGSSARLQPANILPIFEGGSDWDKIPEGMRAMGAQNIYRIHDPASKVPDFILSPVSPKKISYAEAIMDYCWEMKAHLPSAEQFEALSRAMGIDQPSGYNPNLIPDIRGRWFWSSTLTGDDREYFVFNGNDGRFGAARETYKRDDFSRGYKVTRTYVRCVRDAHPRE